MIQRYKSRKQACKYVGGKTVLKEKQRRKQLHVANNMTGKGEWRGLKAA
jgi:hypothetical protein